MRSRFSLCTLLFLTACASGPAVDTPKIAPLSETAISQDWREATDCVIREMEQGGLDRWPLRASSQAASFDFKGEVSTIVVRRTEDMAALYTATIRKTGDSVSHMTITPVGREVSTYTGLVESDLRKAAATCQ